MTCRYDAGIDEWKPGYIFESKKREQAIVKVDGKDYLALYDKDNNQYTLRENGEVFDKENR